ncbi:hypothetical protein FJ444_19370 [Aestuariibacter sp. GS-14]|uniref:hypothetical protein n=1 Tax=Aestuariibacter sp. GS-14 TaxID=2590670 RepID=UPI001127C565|nr:hypothetical protein [Aestuariibacter sp. GS-14]TPV54346.1 hypothetical protein FJ444_19370 [Aestuariibacter sp. GS-14]
MTQEKLSLEWQTLQNQFDSYEKYSLMIKLSAVLLTAIALLTQLPTLIAMALIGVLWLQDGIWKTFQGRFEQRLLAIEAEIRALGATTDCQFNSAYLAQANSGGALIAEYVKQSLRPTVMYPYVALEALIIVAALLIG